jgi:hypothetical protein
MEPRGYSIADLDATFAALADPDGNQIVIHRRHDGTYGQGG